MKQFMLLAGLAIVATATLTGSAGAQQAAISEFRAGQTGQFSSQGHPKAAGLDFIIRYPRSWSAKAGEATHVVQNFISTDGTGSNCNILVRRLDNVTPTQAAQLLHPSNLRELVPAAFTYRSGTPTTLGGQPGAQVLVERPFVGPTSTSYLRLVIYMTIHRSNFINLTCGVGAPDPSQAGPRFDVHLPLFRLVKDSLVLRN
jgi:hypothetical protein